MSELKNSYGVITGSTGIVLSAASIDGLVTGNSSANTDGSITPVKFYIQPDINLIYNLSFVSIEISDSGNPAIDDYGSITGPLANGIQFFLEINGVETDFGMAIKTNRELITLGPATQQLSFSGSTKVTTYGFDVLEHAPRSSVIRLSGDTFDKFGFIVQDDLSSLIEHTLTIKGSSIIRTIT